MKIVMWTSSRLWARVWFTEWKKEHIYLASIYYLLWADSQEQFTKDYKIGNLDSHVCYIDQVFYASYDFFVFGLV